LRMIFRTYDLWIFQVEKEKGILVAFEAEVIVIGDRRAPKE